MVGELRDFDLHLDKGQPSEPSSPPPRWPAVAVGVLLLVLVAGGVYWWYARRAATPPRQATGTATPPEGTARRQAQPLGGPGADIDVPPLGETDALVRDLVGRLSSHPTIAAWLATDGLIRTGTVAVHNVAGGQTPTAQLRRIAPQPPFTVRAEAGRPYVDPGSYARYDGIAAAVASLDTEGTARLYGTLRPRVQEAHAELGSPESSFDVTLERAFVVLLQVPVVEGDVPLVTRGALYAYADPRLEQLSPAQKQLLRTGPRNTRLIQEKLREIARALGIPDERLPVPSSIRSR